MPIGSGSEHGASLGCLMLATLVCLFNMAACASDSASNSDAASSSTGSSASAGADGAHGRAVDADTGEPIEGAWIFEATPRGTRGADVRRVSKARWTRTDAQGRYAFSAIRTSGLGAILSSPAPRYHFYHPSYGLLRGREAGPSPTLFRPSLRAAHLRQADLIPNCSPSRRDALDPMAAQLAKLTCPPGVADRFPNGMARAKGALDERGRRDGPWEFFREDQTLHARGTYSAGAAVPPWSFFPPADSPPTD